MHKYHRYGVVFLMSVLPAFACAETYQGQDDDQLRQFIGLNPGSYIGISVNYDVMNPDLSDHGVRLDEKKKQRKVAWSVQFGSFYAEQSAVEFRYTHYSSYPYRIRFPLMVNRYTSSLDVFGLDWVIHLPLGSRFFVWGRAGVAGILSSTHIVQEQGSSPLVEATVHEKRFSPEAGLGLAVVLGKHLSLRAGYHYLYKPVSKDNVKIKNLSGLEVGVNYLF